ncbi:hypothetical protein [Chitinophaga parva]|uniref:hypothetical protein n=1 Tax=Chitinophaga parva TaxID=2169414 RepID=UPI001057002E|nr:hypothetical protein [Chitinophaga parva]
MKKIVLVVLGILGLSIPVAGQVENDTTKLFQAMAELQSMYKDRYIGFDLKYKYTSEADPKTVLDSVQGKMSFYGARYCYQLENMEMLSNGTYNVVLFKDEKLMYVARASSLVASIDPVAQVREMIRRSGATGYSLEENNQEKKLHIHFVAGGPCRQMDIVVNKKEQRVVEIRYVVKTEMLTQSPETAAGKVDPAYGDYAVVTASFEHYRALTNDAVALDEHRYFFKEGEVLKTAPAYREYKIFRGSPNL